MPPRFELAPRDIVWMEPDPSIGREQTGRRPAIIVAGQQYLDVIDTLALVVPVTSVERGWSNHVAISGLAQPSWAMTEQLRVVSRERLHGHLGRVDEVAFQRIRRWLRDHLDI